MPKVTIKFNLPEENEEFKTTLRAQALASAIHDIREQVFRPARKHGYSEEGLLDLTQSEVELIEKLETIFNQILSDHDIPD